MNNSFSNPNVYLSESEYQYLCHAVDLLGTEKLARYLGISKVTLGMALTRKSVYGTMSDELWQAAYFVTAHTYDKISEGLRLI